MVNYRRYIDDDIAPSSLGRMQLTNIRRFHVSALIDQLIADGRGATTVRRIAAVVQGSLRGAYDEHLIDANPAAGVKLPRVESKEFEAWEPQQVGHFVDVAGTHRLGSLFELAMFTGLRRGELLGLRWTDVDLSRRASGCAITARKRGTRLWRARPRQRRGDALSTLVIGPLAR